MFWVNSSRWAVRKVTNSQQVVTAALCTLPFPAQVSFAQDRNYTFFKQSEGKKKKKALFPKGRRHRVDWCRKIPPLSVQSKPRLQPEGGCHKKFLTPLPYALPSAHQRKKKNVEVINCWIQTSGNQWAVRKPTCGSSYFRAVLINSWKTHRQEDLRKKYSSPYHITMQDNPIQPWFPSSLLLSFFIRYCRISLTSV